MWAASVRRSAAHHVVVDVVESGARLTWLVIAAVFGLLAGLIEGVLFAVIRVVPGWTTFDELAGRQAVSALRRQVRSLDEPMRMAGSRVPERPRGPP
jgi:hypothetical protein